MRYASCIGRCVHLVSTPLRGDPTPSGSIHTTRSVGKDPARICPFSAVSPLVLNGEHEVSQVISRGLRAPGVSFPSKQARTSVFSSFFAFRIHTQVSIVPWCSIHHVSEHA